MLGQGPAHRTDRQPDHVIERPHHRGDEAVSLALCRVRSGFVHGLAAPHVIGDFSRSRFPHSDSATAEARRGRGRAIGRHHHPRRHYVVVTTEKLAENPPGIRLVLRLAVKTVVGNDDRICRQHQTAARNAGRNREGLLQRETNGRSDRPLAGSCPLFDARGHDVELVAGLRKQVSAARRFRCKDKPVHFVDRAAVRRDGLAAVHSRIRCCKVNALPGLPMRPKNCVFRSFLLTLTAACAVLPPEGAAATMDDFALKLKDSIGLVGSNDRAAAEGLRELAASEPASPLRDVVLYFLARAERQIEPRDAIGHLRELLASFTESPLSARAAAELLELEPAMDQSEAVTALADRHGRDHAPRADAARLYLVAGERLAASDSAAAKRALDRARHLGRGDRTSRDAAQRLRELRSRHPELAPQTATEVYEEARLVGAEGDPPAQIEWLDRLIEKFPSSPRLGDAMLLRARALGRSQGRSAAATWLESRAKSGTSSFRASLLHAAANHRWNADEDDRARCRVDAVEVLVAGTGPADAVDRADVDDRAAALGQHGARGGLCAIKVPT